MDNKWWTLIAVCLGTFMLLLDVTIVVVALPQIQGSLHGTFGDVQWVVDAYALTLASLLLTAGVLADRYGRRLLFSIGLALFSLGSLTCGLAQSPLMLIISRSGQGVGGAIMFATSLALLGQSFQGRDRGIAFGVWGAITGIAVSLGPILGGLITTGWSWRGIFLVNLPIGVLALVITVLRVHESKAAHPSAPDWLGFILLTAGLIGLIYGLIRASESSWSDATVVGSLVAGAALLAGFILAEAKVPNPMFDLSLFRTPTFTGGLIAAFTMNGSLFAMFLYLVLYLQDLLGYSALQTGLRLLVSTAGTFFAAALSGRLSEHVPVRWLIGPGLILTGVGLVLMGGLSASSTWSHLLPGFVISGVGGGLVNPALASTAIGVVRPERSGMASGVNSTFRQIGFAVSVAVLGSIFTSTVERRLSSILSHVHGIAISSTQVAAQIRQGNIAATIRQTAPAHRHALVYAIRSAFTSGIDELVLVAGVIAFVGAVVSAPLIRRQDFLPRGSANQSGQSSGQVAPTSGVRPLPGSS